MTLFEKRELLLEGTKLEPMNMIKISKWNLALSSEDLNVQKLTSEGICNVGYKVNVESRLERKTNDKQHPMRMEKV